MKQKVLIIVTALFFLIVNTTYFWEGKLGFYAMPMSLFLVGYYVVLAGIFFQQSIYLVRERFRNRRRSIITACLLMVLALTFLQPAGIIDFDKLSGKDVLIAQQEGVANCIRSDGTQNGKMSGDLVLYKGRTDTSGYPLFIVKNELRK
jgi:hypothetical protein